MSDSAVRELTHKILARPEYAAVSNYQSKLEDWLRRFLQWIAKLELLRGNSPLLYWLIVLAVAAVCAGLIAHVTWTVWIAMTAPEPASSSGASAASFRDLAQEAESLAANGRYLDAAHRLMLATYRTLAERSVIELRPDRSNRWIRAALRRSTLGQSLALEIEALVERTERRWFGDRARDRMHDHTDDPEIYARWRSAFEQLSSQAQ
jgi:hypothetical protein